MQGRDMERSSAGSLVKPRGCNPKVLAAFMTFEALLPSRETPQAVRNSSSGTILPWYPRTMARAAAPHSTASICKMVGVRTRLNAFGAGAGVKVVSELDI